MQQGLAYNRAIIDTTKEIIGAQDDVVQYLHVLMVSSGEAVFKEHRGPFKEVSTDFSNYYAAVQGGSAEWQARVGGGVPVGSSRISGMLMV